MNNKFETDHSVFSGCFAGEIKASSSPNFEVCKVRTPCRANNTEKKNKNHEFKYKTHKSL